MGNHKFLQLIFFFPYSEHVIGINRSLYVFLFTHALLLDEVQADPAWGKYILKCGILICDACCISGNKMLEYTVFIFTTTSKHNSFFLYLIFFPLQYGFTNILLFLFFFFLIYFNDECCSDYKLIYLNQFQPFFSFLFFFF